MGTLKHLIQSGETEEAEKYIDKIRQIIYNSSEKISTGNLAIDNMLNCKLCEAANSGIDTKIDNQIPSNLELDVFAMNIILGNLMDNAIEATSKLKMQKEIKIDLKIDSSIKNKSKLSIEIKNNYVGTIKYYENKIISSKKDSKNGTFTVEAIIPINLQN